MTDQATRAQQAVQQACRILAGEGVMNAFGHVSVRSGAQLLISERSSPALAASRPVHAVPLELSGEDPLPRGVPIEVFAHSRVYRARPDVQAIARTHGEYANVLSIVGVEARPVHFLATVLGSAAPVHDDPRLITTPQLGDDVAAALGDHAAVLMRGNGQVVVGRSLAEACVRSVYLEETARLQALAMQTGTHHAFTDDELEDAAAIWADPINVDRAWSHLLAQHAAASA